MKKEVIGSVLIAGGGIASIQAALDLADSGYYVYMVEKSPSIGGVMAQLDKTFPTNDCSMCIMSPKLVEVGRHINIELITLAEIKDIRGEAGNFEVEVFQKARYVDMDKCIACGACTEKCPKRVDDEYNTGLAKRKAIYVPYPQAVPLKYAIDAENCIKLTRDKCGNCEKVCPAGAINYEDKDKTLNFKVGSVILASGFSAYNPSGNSFLNYDHSKDVLTSLEFERLLSASGPLEGHLVRLSDKVVPKKIAWLQCVGSRELNTCDNEYCSSVCCMYAIKQAIIAKEHDPDLETKIFYMDMRTHGKGFEDCYNQAKENYGVKFQRCRVHTVYSNPEGPGQVLEYIDEDGKRATEIFDLVVLSVGMEISSELRGDLARMGIEVTEGGFVKTSTFKPVTSSRPGIYVCGALQGPKDIPQSVVEAGAAALNAGAALTAARNTLTRTLVQPEEDDVRGDRPRIGVFVCHCGSNIAGVIDVESVRDYAADLPYVEYVANNMYSCSQDTQDAMTKVIQENGLNRIVVAACSPRTHEPLFQETLINASLNKYLFEMVNIRNHGSWVHKDSPEEATVKAKEQVRMAVAKAALFEPLSEASLEVDQNVLVIGGGISGLSTAKALSSQDYHVTLVERDSVLGGQARSLYKTSSGESIEENLNALIEDVKADANIRLMLNSKLVNLQGFVGNFISSVESEGSIEEVRHGVAIIASGAKELKPEEYSYGSSDKIMTAQELDGLMKADDPRLKEAETAVFIQCVGSREPGRPYCSRICCTHTMLSALHLKEKNPEMDIFVLYRDIRTYGEKEYLYKKARDLGVIFIAYTLENKPVVELENEELSITVMDHILKKPLLISADMLVLASAVVPYKDEALAQFFKVPLDESGFFVESHVKLAPSDFATDGVFLAGLAHYPKPIDEAIAQAQAAAARATGLLARKTISTSGTIAYLKTELCAGCGVCVVVCPYNAPAMILEGPMAGKAEVNPVLCKGCGVCVASCRSGALNLKGFEEGQIIAMIDVA